MMYECPTTQPMSEVVNIVSPGSPQKRCFIEAVSATAWPPTSRCTPFGRPVVPDVYKMYEGWFDSSHAHETLAPACSLASDAQSTSRPVTLGMLGSSPRRKMSTLFGGCLATLSDSSTSDLYSTGLPMRLPPSAVIISAGCASSMRAARLAAAKPPNTTEWIAPSRAQERMAKAASGIIGM